MEKDYLNGNSIYFLIFYLFLILIKRSDGREYNGYWKNGKQNGEGLFYSPEEKKWKKGIWNEGKRVRWINNN